MKKQTIIITIATVLAIISFSSCATSAPDRIDLSQLNLVKENRSTETYKGRDYHLDSYIRPFQNPYYVKVSSADGKPVSKEDAVQIAIKYIKPRGCTSTPVRKPNLDRSNKLKSQWLIGISC